MLTHKFPIPAQLVEAPVILHLIASYRFIFSGSDRELIKILIKSILTYKHENGYLKKLIFSKDFP